jgi:hypothetical protein
MSEPTCRWCGEPTLPVTGYVFTHPQCVNELLDRLEAARQELGGPPETLGDLLERLVRGGAR